MDSAARLAATAAGALDDLALLELRRVSLPLRRPHVAAHGTEEGRELVVVRAVGADGVEGWGECPTLSTAGYSTETTDLAWGHLCDELAPRLAAGSLTETLAAGEVLDASFPMASSGLEGALVDLGLRRQGTSLLDVLGVATRRLHRCTVVTLTAIDGAGGVDDGHAAVVEAVAAAVAGGAVMVKLKVDPRRGVGHVAAVRAAFETLPLAVDANGSLDGHPELLEALDDLRLAYLEQPLPPAHPGAAAPAVGVSTPVALDESATGPEALAVALAAGEGSVVNLKAARVGGIVPALRCWEVARRAAADVFVGGMLESALGRAPAVALAAAVGGGDDDLPTDLGPSAQYFATDLGLPVVLDGAGRLVVPEGRGSGATPDAGAIETATVARWSLPCR